MSCFLGLALTGSLLVILFGTKRWEGRRANRIMEYSDPGKVRSYKPKCYLSVEYPGNHNATIISISEVARWRFLMGLSRVLW
jgi:hypothetical protein